jgi:large subunit ribosomal protein L6
MSRIGKHAVDVPQGVDVNIDGAKLTVKGKHGQLSMRLVDEVTLDREEDKLWVRPRDASRRARAMWGLQRSLVNNMVSGVSDGFTRTLEITGVGFRAAVQGKALNLQLGFSHDILYPIPDGVQINCPTPNQVTIFGADRQQVGQVAAEIRGFRPPEPYKGKGVRYSDETIIRKEGKKK